MKPRMRTATVIVLIFLMIVSSGCSFGGGSQATEKFDPKKNATIKVMDYDERYFMQKYGYLFMAKYPNIEIEVVSTKSMYKEGQEDDPEVMYKKFIEEHQPDVIMVPGDQLEELVNDQMLYDLEPIIAQDKFDIENIHPTIIEYLKMKGGGKLYGLAPNFRSEALYINRDLFNKHGVELPAEPMTWESMLNLAGRFPTGGDKESRIYGFTNQEWQSDAYNLIMMIGLQSGLVAQTEGKASLNSPAWKTIFELVTNAAKSGTVLLPPPPDFSGGMLHEDWLMRNKFVTGKVAMTIGDISLINNLNEVAEYKKDLQFNWEIINLPKAADSTQRTNFYINDVFAINAKSTNHQAAWEFIKYVNGDEIARVLSKTPTNLWSRTTYKSLKDGVSLEPFYQLSYNSSETIEFGKYDTAWVMVQDEANKLIEEYMADKKTLDQLLEAINTKIQEGLDNIKLNENKEEAK